MSPQARRALGDDRSPFDHSDCVLGWPRLTDPQVGAGGPDDQSAKPRAIGFNHVALEVGDTEETLAFYGRLFNFELRGKSDTMAFIDLGNGFSPCRTGPPAVGERRWGNRSASRPVLRECKSSINDWVTFAAVPCVVFQRGAGMTDTIEIAGDRIRSFIERVEHIDEEIKALNEGKKEVLAQAKGEGFDVKVLKEILRLRKLDKDERDEHKSLLDLYLRAMEGAGPQEEAKAA